MLCGFEDCVTTFLGKWLKANSIDLKWDSRFITNISDSINNNKSKMHYIYFHILQILIVITKKTTWKKLEPNSKSHSFIFSFSHAVIKPIYSTVSIRCIQKLNSVILAMHNRKIREKKLEGQKTRGDLFTIKGNHRKYSSSILLQSPSNKNTTTKSRSREGKVREMLRNITYNLCYGTFFFPSWFFVYMQSVTLEGIILVDFNYLLQRASSIREVNPS